MTHQIKECNYRNDCGVYCRGDKNCLTEHGGDCHIPKYLEDRARLSQIEVDKRIVLEHVRQICTDDFRDMYELYDAGLPARFKMDSTGNDGVNK